MITSPHHHHQPPTTQAQSPKHKRDVHSMPSRQPARLQTANLNQDNGRSRSSRKLSTTSVEDTLSPRGLMSDRLQGLHLQGSESRSPTGRVGVGRRSSLVVLDSPEREVMHGDQEEDKVMTSKVEEKSDGGDQDTNADVESTELAENMMIRETGDFQRPVFQFRAGGPPQATPTELGPKTASPFKRAAFTMEDNNDSTSMMTPSPQKRQRRSSPPTSPSPNPIRIPRSKSPSASKLKSQTQAHRSPPPLSSDLSSSPTSDIEPTHNFWWQPSEIIGHDPDDPEDDHRGVNGIGYQKTKAEQWRISERKKRQLAEWRSREAKEARSLRAGGRRVIMGRVGKVGGSRAGSPTGDMGRRSPKPRSVSDEKRMEEVVRRAVRFEL